MKKLLIIAAITVAIVAMTGSVAMAGVGASGYNTVTGATASIHGSYTSAGNECEVCHAVHGATGSYKLLRDNSAAAACDTCHVSGTALVSTARVYTEAAPQAEHRIGLNGATPDLGTATVVAANGLVCMSCHNAAPHGDGANVSGILSTTGYVGTEQAFCARCHEANNAGTDTHVFDAAADNVRAFVASGDCNDCHTATVVQGYPHESAQMRFISGTVAGDGIDDACIRCHVNGVTSGVGITY